MLCTARSREQNPSSDLATIPGTRSARVRGRDPSSLLSPSSMRHHFLGVAAVVCTAALVTAQCVPPTRLQTTPTFEVGAFYGTSSLDPGPCSYFDLDVTAGLTIQRLALGYDDVALAGTPARVELWL